MTWTRHPAFLIACLVVGSLAGVISPDLARALAVPGQLAGALLEMAALPLVLTATAFGLRNVLALPHPVRRLSMGLAFAVVSLWLAGLTGAATGALLAPGKMLDENSREDFGRLIQKVGGAAERTEVALLAQPVPEPPKDLPGLPENAFAAMVQGNLPAMLWCTLLLSLPFVLMPRERSQPLAQLLEAIYRTLEQLIHLSNRLLPLLAFGMAAHLSAQLEWTTVRLLAPLLGAMLIGACVICSIALWLVANQASHSLGKVLFAMRAPLLVAFLAPSPAAAMPNTIDALSGRLGLSRGVAELVVPAGCTLLVAGSAAQAALIAVYVAHLYDQVLSPAQLVWIGSLAAGASVITRSTSTGTLAPAALVLLWLRLPAEAVLPVLLLIDGLTRGMSQVTALCCVAATSAWLARGLPSERLEPASTISAPTRPWQLTLSRAMAVTVLVCVLCAALLSTLAGIGMGLRHGQQLVVPQGQR